MTLEQIDAALAEWQGKLNLASANLLELDDLFTYKRLRGTAGEALVGVTRDRVGPALAAMDQLWQSLALLTDTVSRAQAVRKSASRLWATERAGREIEQILTGPSVLMPAPPAPLAQRELLSTADSTLSITPSQLLSTMMGAFDAAKSTILAVDAAWNRLEPLLAAAEREADALQALAEELGEPAPPDLATGRQKIEGLGARVATDPLGVQTDFAAELSPLLARARAWLDDLAHQRDKVAADQTRARALLQALTSVAQDCVAAYEECREKAAATSGPVPPPDAAQAADLAAWLATLDAALGQGHWKAARIGLDRWLLTAEANLADARAALAANRASLEKRAELRGCLASLRVKAQSYAARGVTLDPALAAVAGQAERLLSSRPTPLEEAARLVSDYEARLARALKAGR